MGAQPSRRRLAESADRVKRVEALFAGPPDLVSRMIALCRRGPASARVDAVEEEPANADALRLRRPGERFSVLPTI